MTSGDGMTERKAERGDGARARVLMPTLRRLNPGAAWCSNYEFEDVIRRVDDVDVLELQPGPAFELRHRVARSLAWRSWQHARRTPASRRCGSPATTTCSSSSA